LRMGTPARKLTGAQLERSARMDRARSIIEHGATALKKLTDCIDDDFAMAVDRIVKSSGSLIVCGIGKAGLIGRKLSATFASTGTPSHFLHPSEAIHGDLGSVGANDIVLVLSNSGSSKEILDLLPYVMRRASGLIAITSGANSPLAQAADISLILPPLREACHHNLAPTTSTLAMLALGDALALVVSEVKGFQANDFALLHPGGALGRKLACVEDVMRPLSECRIGRVETSIRQTLVEASRPGRRSGAVMILDQQHLLRGIFTDSDLARILEQRCEAELDQPVSTRMTTQFSAIRVGAKLTDAIEMMTRRKISELPVIDNLDHPVGMLDITDLLGLDSSPTGDSESIEQSEPEESTGEISKSAGDEEWLDGPTTLRIFGPFK
jgi:arabinose-5-phosphate isomerase